MINKAQNIRQSLQQGVQWTKLIDLVIKSDTLSEQDRVVLNKSLSYIELQTKQIATALGEVSSRYQGEESKAKQQIWERKLLDLTMHNNLLNTRVGKNVFALEHSNIAELEDSLHRGEEHILQSKALTQIYRTARNHIEESGANALFVTLGTLIYSDTKTSKQCKAPLLLVPVEITKTKGKDTYAIRKRDDETMLNITLLELLKSEYDIRVTGVNPLPTDEQGVDVSLVFHRFEEAIAGHVEWKVSEEAMLGIFSYTKLVMWNDIHTHASEMATNPIIHSLIEGRLIIDSMMEEINLHQEDDISPSAHLVPLAADSSQMAAIIAAEKGQSFVLQGPPGTGKSQSITNIIANAIYRGQRVLFVAQKKAALDVVKQRLDKLGLAPFSLELHSNKIDKKYFLHQLQTAIDFAIEKSDSNFSKLADDLLAERRIIGYHIQALHRKRDDGYSLYDCIEKSLAVQTPITIPAELLEKDSTDLLENLLDKVVALDACAVILGTNPNQHPLCGLYPYAQPTTQMPISYGRTETLEDILKTIPSIVAALKQQIERNQKMAYFSKTTRQYIEGDYKLKKFFQYARIDENLYDDIDLFANALQRWIEHVDMLPQWKQYATLVMELQQDGLSELTMRYSAGETLEELTDAIKAGYFKAQAQKIISHDASLSEYNGIQLNAIIEKYNTLYHEFKELSRQELIYRLSSHNITKDSDPTISTELTLLRKRISNNGRGTTIRSMIEQVPHLLGKLCPVMLMSPLSVAQYINPESEKFDIVIFDEASQMPTCDAVGAIARAKNAIVVGDIKQMPPTNFFSASATDEAEADVDDLESVLEDCIALSMPTYLLNWHYRSHHEDLISFSNQHYYDNSLITFPSCDDCCSHVTLQHVDGYYDAGKTRTNLSEAQAIVTEICTRLKSQPHQSIGVVAFSSQQSNLIEDLLNDIFATNPDIERINLECHEPLFVKNLENVQGDERDVILFSVGYGPNKDGKISMNFGPLNKIGGEKRLNVAVTRARKEMKVFATLFAEDIDERRTQAEGVLSLKSFLRYAEGRRHSSVQHEASHSPITTQIAQWLYSQGYNVTMDLGTSVCKVDIAVFDSKKTSKYQLGIITDGVHCKQLKTIDDIEIVRPLMLRRLGWKIVQIRTIDWLLHSEIVKKQIMDELK